MVRFYPSPEWFGNAALCRLLLKVPRDLHAKGTILVAFALRRLIRTHTAVEANLDFLECLVLIIREIIKFCQKYTINCGHVQNQVGHMKKPDKFYSTNNSDKLIWLNDTR